MTVDVKGKRQRRFVILVFCVTVTESLFCVIEIGRSHFVESDPLFTLWQEKSGIGLTFSDNSCVLFLGLRRTVGTEIDSLAVNVDDGVLSGFLILGGSGFQFWHGHTSYGEKPP